MRHLTAALLISALAACSSNSTSEVTNPAQNSQTLANAQGQFTFRDVPAGTCTVRAMDGTVVSPRDAASGLATGKRLTSEGIRINVTLVFSPAQAILAVAIGAYIVLEVPLE